ncbi:hypothetical protein B0H13DRAFT_1904803 [Mycena leptocephala]|nr:hypothetical protein B0H13DRAFT_1904803 [Mycena leptocephala]
MTRTSERNFSILGLIWEGDRDVIDIFDGTAERSSESTRGSSLYFDCPLTNQCMSRNQPKPRVNLIVRDPAASNPAPDVVKDSSKKTKKPKKKDSSQPKPPPTNQTPLASSQPQLPSTQKTPLAIIPSPFNPVLITPEPQLPVFSPIPTSAVKKTAIQRSPHVWSKKRPAPDSESVGSNKKQITIMDDSESRKKLADYEAEISKLKAQNIAAGKRITQLEADLEDSRERYDALDLRTKDWQCPAGEVGGDHQSCGTKITNLEEAYELLQSLHDRAESDLANRLCELDGTEKALEKSEAENVVLKDRLFKLEGPERAGKEKDRKHDKHQHEDVHVYGDGQDHLTIMKPTDGEPVLGLNERDFKAHLADLEPKTEIDTGGSEEEPMGTRSATTMLPTDDEVVLGLNEPDFKAHLANLKMEVDDTGGSKTPLPDHTNRENAKPFGDKTALATSFNFAFNPSSALGALIPSELTNVRFARPPDRLIRNLPTKPKS